MKLCKFGYCNNPREYQIDYKHPFCKSCHNYLRPKLGMGKDKRLAKALESMVWRAKDRAEKKNLEFNLSFDWCFNNWPKDNKCPILGIEFKNDNNVYGSRNTSASLDRIDPNKGYTEDNVQIISSLANRMKNNANKEQLIAFSNWIKETYNERN